jgi:hypothetical protein
MVDKRWLINGDKEHEATCEIKTIQKFYFLQKLHHFTYFLSTIIHIPWNVTPE